MELTFVALSIAIIGVLVWTVWRLAKIQRQLNAYTNYVNQLQDKATEEVLSEEFLNQMRNRAQLELTNTVKSMDQQLQQSLGKSHQQLLNNIEQQAAQIINGELEKYQQTIAEARNSAANVSQETEKQLEESQKDIQEKAQAAIGEEKKQLTQRLDEKLGDIITHYLLEALGEHVDLGSQKDYIISGLESRKEEIKRDINDAF
jgi:F0F1-type ATP synthase membrane subunit b/b'